MLGIITERKTIAKHKNLGRVHFNMKTLYEETGIVVYDDINMYCSKGEIILTKDSMGKEGVKRKLSATSENLARFCVSLSLLKETEISVGDPITITYEKGKVTIRKRDEKSMNLFNYDDIKNSDRIKRKPNKTTINK